MDAQRLADESKEQRNRTIRRLNDLQFGPVKQLPMLALMMWMSGNELNLFSIMITGNAVSSPISMLMNTNATFKVFETDATLTGEIWRAKAVYFLMCLVCLAAGLLKLSWLGLVPTAAADWQDHTPPTYSTLSTQL